MNNNTLYVNCLSIIDFSSNNRKQKHSALCILQYLQCNFQIAYRNENNLKELADDEFKLRCMTGFISLLSFSFQKNRSKKLPTHSMYIIIFRSIIYVICYIKRDEAGQTNFKTIFTSV